MTNGRNATCQVGVFPETIKRINKKSKLTARLISPTSAAAMGSNSVLNAKFLTMLEAPTTEPDEAMIASVVAIHGPYPVISQTT